MSDETSTEQPPIDNDHVAEGCEQFAPIVAVEPADPPALEAPADPIPEDSPPQTAQEAAAGEKHEVIAWIKAEFDKIEGWPEAVKRRVDGTLDKAKVSIPTETPEETQ